MCSGAWGLMSMHKDLEEDFISEEIKTLGSNKFLGQERFPLFCPRHFGHKLDPAESVVGWINSRTTHLDRVNYSLIFLIPKEKILKNGRLQTHCSLK